MELTYQEKAEKLQINLPCFADGVGKGYMGYSFNGEGWRWTFGTGKYGESFECTDEFVQKAVDKNKAYITKEWNKSGLGN